MFIKDMNDKMPIYYAIENGHEDVANYLVDQIHSTRLYEEIFILIHKAIQKGII